MGVPSECVDHKGMKVIHKVSGKMDIERLGSRKIESNKTLSESKLLHSVLKLNGSFAW